MAAPRAAIVLLLGAAALLVSGAAANKHCNPEDEAALLKIKSEFNNAYHFASWVTTDPCCEWYDVHCDPSTNRVDGLSIFQDANVTGRIPEGLAGLPFLTQLMFHHLPGVSGAIPRVLTKLRRLQFLTISYTGISGPVPSFLGELTALTQLDLSFNSLSGSIPPELGGIASLMSIDISRNHLAGSLPAALFSKVPADQQCYLRLSHNSITGAIPPAFRAVSFEQVDLSRNQLAGDASVLFGKGKQLQQLDLSRNRLSFDLSGVEFPLRAIAIDLSHNEITGGIPAEVTAVAQLQLFNVSYNRLCGPIPQGAYLAELDQYDFAHNRCLCGAPLPPCQ